MPTPYLALHVVVSKVSPAFDDAITVIGGRVSSIAGYCQRALADVRALCRDAGIPASRQRQIKGPNATRARVIAELEAAAAALPTDALFVLSFAGHGSQLEDTLIDEADGLDEAWCLYDGPLLDDELGVLLDRFAKRAHVAVVSDCCYSSGLAGFRHELGGFHHALPRPLVPPRRPGVSPSPARHRTPRPRVALVGATQGSRVIADNTPTLAGRIRAAIFTEGARDPDCPDYGALETLLVTGQPADKRPTIWCSPDAVRSQVPFAPL